MWVAGLVCACSSQGTPVESPVTGNAVTIVLPKNVDGADGPLKGVSLDSVDRLTEQKPAIGSYTNNPIKDFYSLNTTVPTPGTLLTRICQGEQYSDGRRDKSCVTYEARLQVEEKPDTYQLSIMPIKIVTQKGRNVLGLAVDLPNVDISDWYQHITSETVTAHHKVTSKLTPDTIKAAFDRRFKKRADTEGSANAALRQFKDQYDLPANSTIRAVIGANISPYESGSMADCDIVLTSSGASSGGTVQDFSAALASVQQEIEKAATE